VQGMAVDEAVERYVSLQVQIKDLQLQLDEIKPLIADFCQAEGLNHVYSREHTITCKLVERTFFSEDEVRALLEPTGLWQQVLSFDQVSVNRLLADEGVAEGIRIKLEALKQVISASPRLWVRRLIEE